MGLDLSRFRAARFERPTDEVPVPELAAYIFTNGDKPVVKVRGLTLNEQWLARERMQKNSPTQQLLQAVKDNPDSELASVFQRLLGVNTEATAAETAYRLELVQRGVIAEEGKPLFDLSDVVRLSEHFPLVFVRLSEKILQLSGQASTDVGGA